MGCFLVKRLFGAHTAADGQAPVWHEDVRYFQIADETGMQSLTLFGSLQSPSQEGWGVDGYCIGRAKITDEVARPPSTGGVFGVQPNSPVDGKPSLMTFNEVETLHEFGHGLHHSHADWVDWGGRYQQCRVGRGGTATSSWKTGAIIEKRCWVWRALRNR